MGLLDKVKAVAKDVATEAKKGTATLQGKIEVGQLRKKADEAAKQLGYLIYRERKDGTPAGEEADTLVTEMAQLEEQIKAEQAEAEAKVAAAETSAPTVADAPPVAEAGAAAAPAEPPVSPPPTTASEPEAGDFKLD